MKLKQLGANQTVLYTNHGDEVLYSYETPVAGFKRGIGHFKNRKYYSNTTSKHVNAYLKGIDEVTLLSHEQIDELFLGE